MALAGLIQPLTGLGRGIRLPWRASSIWFPWWWSAGNLAVFSSWAVAKPNYYVPCLPGLALLTGMAWIRLSRAAHGRSGSIESRLARGLLWLQGLLLLLSGISAPLLGRIYLATGSMAWLLVIGGTASAGVIAGAWAWRRGRSVLALMPVTAALPSPW